jgi:two-component system sensor histidine kinase KdpD
VSDVGERFRADPDVLLAAIEKEAAAQRRGRLKVFLGMSAGVGKTYAMLEAAHRARREGREVVIGYVETHGRKETDALVTGLPLIPRGKVEYRGVTLEEMDIDAVLARRPQLALVDELAHTNVPGSRHTKRYQDVVELLDAGIDVYTTLNVQHVESRADTVRQISGATISETVPDSVLDGAQMEVVDLPPDELLKRLDEGKVYLPDRAEAAMMNFFRIGNLTTLREMALRLAAEHVGQDVHDYMQAMQIAGPWKSGHRLLVAISASPYSANMVRWTRRLADSLDCPWLVVHVERPEALAEEAQTRLTQNLALARELGAEVITTADTDVARALLRVARQHNVTQIVVGKPGGLRILDRIRGAAFLRRLIAASGDIDVNVVRADKADTQSEARRVTPALESQLRQYGIGVIAVAVATAFNAALDTFVGCYALALIYLLTVVALALFVGRGPVFLAATLSALLWNFFFLLPRHTFLITNVQDALMFGMYFVVALVLGQLTARIRAQERAERRREKRSTALYLLTRDLADAGSVDEMSQRLVAQVGRGFECSVALLLREADGNLARTPHPASTFAVTEKEQGVAAWAFRFAKAAGRFTDNLPLSEALHLPLVTKQGAIGVLSVQLASDKPPTLEQRDLLDAFARQATLVLDRLRLTAEAEQARVVAESERLSKSLLNSVSHELRTPIAAITTAVSALDSITPGDRPELARALTGEIQTSTARLNRLVANLLDMTRLESGRVKPRLEWCDVKDLVNAAVRKTDKELAQHKVAVSLPPHLPLVKLDAVLMEQVLLNLLVNAACYTPPGTLVEISARASAQELSLTVADHGPGLPPESVPHVFEKFYRVPGAPAGGTGLGLSIVKGFTEAQGGRAEAANREGGGAVFTLCFPIADTPPSKDESQP